MTYAPVLNQDYGPERCAALLRRSPIFEDLPADLLGRLIELARVRRLGRRALLFAQGDEGDALYAVAEGLIGISIADRGAREVTLSLMEPGDVFGEIALLDGLPRTATARAVESSVLLVIERSAFVAMAESEVRLAWHLSEMLCERLRMTTESVSEFAFLDLRRRLARKLEALAITHGRQEPDGVRIDLKLSQSALAHMLGVSRESINKQLKAWSDGDILRFHRGFITVFDKDRLSADSGRMRG